MSVYSFMVGSHRLTPLQIGLSLPPMSLGFLGASIAPGRLTPRSGVGVLAAGGALTAVGLVWLGLDVDARCGARGHRRDDERSRVSTPRGLGATPPLWGQGSPTSQVNRAVPTEPASRLRQPRFTRRLLAQRVRSLGDVARGERRDLGTVERIHAPALVAGQPQRLAVERLLEQRTNEARVAGLLI